MNFTIDQRVQTWILAYMGAALATLILLVAPAPALAKPLHIVALGASNTYSKGVLRSESYPAQLEALLKQRGIDAIVDNAGVSGDTTHDMVQRLDRAVPPETQIVILQPGGNDQRRGRKGERNHNIALMREVLAARGITVILMENDMLQSIPSRERVSDRIHFTPRGYALLAQHVLPQVEMALGHYQVSEIRK